MLPFQMVRCLSDSALNHVLTEAVEPLRVEEEAA